MNESRLLNVLVIEDDKIEILKFGRVVSQMKVKHNITYAQNGEEAIDLLTQTNTVLPELIVLDLNMPRFDGFEFLKMMKATSHLKYIPVVIMTTSENKKDLKRCYELGIAGYLIKPLDYDTYTQKVNTLFDYWILNELLGR